jgi:heme exporter protein B
MEPIPMRETVLGERAPSVRAEEAAAQVGQPALGSGPEATLSTFATPVAMRTGGGIVAYLRKVRAVTAKELRAELRAKESFSTMVAFGLLAVLIFGLAFDLRVPDPKMVAPGVIWVVILFTGVLGLNRSFGAELDRGSLAALLLAPVDRSAIGDL